MNLSNHYWYFKGVLTPRFCDEVIKYANSQKETMAITGGYGDERDLNKKDMVIVTGNQRSWFAKKHGYTHISAEFVE